MTPKPDRGYTISRTRREEEVIVIDSVGLPRKWKVWGLDVTIDGFEEFGFFVHRSIAPQTGYTLSERSTGHSLRINPNTSERSSGVVRQAIKWLDQNGITSERLKEQIARRGRLDSVIPKD